MSARLRVSSADSSSFGAATGLAARAAGPMRSKTARRIFLGPWPGERIWYSMNAAARVLEPAGGGDVVVGCDDGPRASSRALPNLEGPPPPVTSGPAPRSPVARSADWLCASLPTTSTGVHSDWPSARARSPCAGLMFAGGNVVGQLAGMKRSVIGVPTCLASRSVRSRAGRSTSAPLLHCSPMTRSVTRWRSSSGIASGSNVCSGLVSAAPALPLGRSKSCHSPPREPGPTNGRAGHRWPL